MSIATTIKLYQDAIADLAQNQAEDALLVALDAKALVTTRWYTLGTNFQGSSFTDYNPVYAEQREEKGLQTEFKDFNDTGDLNASLQPFVVAEDVGKVTVEVKARDRENQAKLNGQAKRDGNILLMSEQEEKIVLDAWVKRRLARMNKII